MRETAVHPIESISGEQHKKFVQEVLHDYWTCCMSREASLVARREVLGGKAKFGIVGDGKEVPQVAMARAFKKGDFKSGYYRDQTFMFALGLSTVEDFFAQLYADSENDPFSGGRQMNSHYATKMVDADGNWTEHKNNYNVTSDISCTGGQMARALGLALASRKYSNNENLQDTPFSNQGKEVSFVTIGDASTSEGIFFEVINAACVMQVPLAVSVWDDGYGISVPAKYQTTKQNISEILEGFRIDERGSGMDIYVAKGWDYPTLCEMYDYGIEHCRETMTPALFHIQELTQPQGHSTSGSHERYKPKERLEWEREHDCIKKMREWILDSDLATEEKILELEACAKQTVKDGKNNAWNRYYQRTKDALAELQSLNDAVVSAIPSTKPFVDEVVKELYSNPHPTISEVVKAIRKISSRFTREYAHIPAITTLNQWVEAKMKWGKNIYETNLYSHSARSALKIGVIVPEYDESSPMKNGFEIINTYFDKKMETMPNLYAFGEDVGKIGDVNQGFAGLQSKYGEHRIFDTGIREWSIIGQAIGLAMRGLRPVAEIQYLDYLMYGLEPLTDDLATLRYRSNGIQQAPAVIRTRGHRLEGIWHSGSPMGMMINALRGIYLCVPRNMTQAVGMYSTVLQSNDPAIVVECLNGYRLKEKLPTNIESFTVPLGIPEVLQTGSDITLVTYGSCVRVAEEGLKLLEHVGISVELVDIQTLLPFDIEHKCVASLQKTNRLIIMDEDVPGGASAYLLREILEIQGGYKYLDSSPITLTASANRPPFGSDGDYFSKPNAEDVFDVVYKMMHEVEPSRFPKL
ncbi:MAG: transketolase [Saprospiraceae bacterium]|nr:transketolase [Saprospiraceae bacterium]